MASFEASPALSTDSANTQMHKMTSVSQSPATSSYRSAIGHDPSIVAIGKYDSQVLNSNAAYPPESLHSYLACTPPAPQPQRQRVDHSLDRYAGVYVPRWLHDVNSDPHYIHVPLPELQGLDVRGFAGFFLPQALLETDAFDELVQESKARQIAPTSADDRRESEELNEPALAQPDDSWLCSSGADFLDEALEEERTDDDSLQVQPSKQMHGTQHTSVGAVPQTFDNRLPSTSAQESFGLFAQNSGTHINAEEIHPRDVPEFTLASYSQRLLMLLHAERAYCTKELASQSLFSIKVTVYRGRAKAKALHNAWSDEGLYSLVVPGIREDYPNLVPGDLVQLRVLATNSPAWLRLVLDARVYGVRKAEGFVILKCDTLSTHLGAMFPNVESVRFNVQFCNAERGTKAAIEGVQQVGRVLNDFSTASGSAMRGWLFPSQTVESVQTQKRESRQGVISWYDPHLNTEQKDAVAAIALTPSRMQSHRTPFLIAGPPGTGKTKTIVEMALQILQHQPLARVLLVAPSPTAADTLAFRLAAHLQPDQMIRINDQGRTFAEVPQSLLLYCSIDETEDGAASFGLPSWSKFAAASVVVLSTADVHVLLKSKVSNVDLGRWHAKTLAPSLGPQFKPQLHWTHLLVDEAGQATEAELSNALLTVVPSPYHSDKDAVDLPAVVLCGDVSQLGPHVQSHFARSHALDVSLLERLSRRKPFRGALSELRKVGRQAVLRGDYAPQSLASGDHRLPGTVNVAHLVRNYRARQPALLQGVSMLFYDDALLPCAPSPTLDLSTWDGLPNRQMPLFFEHIDAPDEWVDEGASFYNVGEIQRVVELCQSLTSVSKTRPQRLAAPEDVAVITPYREQVWRIRMALRGVGLSGVSVGNVEVYQGLEHRISIISTVRSSRRFLPLDAKRSMGLVFERKRLCVAISRAMEALLIVGNANLLKVDPFWRSLLAHAKRNGTFRGNNTLDDDAVLDDAQIGALEYAARNLHPHSDSGNGIRPSAGDGLHGAEGEVGMLAGRMAATALFEDEDEDADGAM